LYEITSNGDQVALKYRELGIRPLSDTFSLARTRDILTGSHPLIGNFSISRNDAGVHVVGFVGERDARRVTPLASASPIVSKETRAATFVTLFKSELKQCIADEFCGRTMTAETRELLAAWSDSLAVEVPGEPQEAADGPVRRTTLEVSIASPALETVAYKLPALTLKLEGRTDYLAFEEVTERETNRLLRIDGRGGRSSKNGEWPPWIAAAKVLDGARRVRK
jgi:hypothetical protein